MMRKILCSLLIMLFAASAFAQLSGGMKGGINFSQQKWKVELDGISGSEKYKGTAFHIGGYLNYKLTDVVFLQPELMYNSLKFDIETDDLVMNYFSIPVLLGYSFEQGKFNLHAGPQLGFLLSTGPSEFKDDDLMKSIDFSLCFGLTYNVDKLNFTLRYSAGLSELVTDDLDDFLEAEFGAPIDLSIKNNNLQISIGYKLFGE